MKTHLCLDLTLIDDAVFSSRSATAGDHETLDFIPGSTLWGLASALLYRHLPQRASALAYGGGLRATSGLPLSAATQSLGLPLPLCWHEDKTKPAARGLEDGRVRSAHVRNLQSPAAVKKIGQPKQLRGGYVTVHGEHLLPKRHFALKTAIDADGRAAKAQLFGYESLAAGTRFRAWLGIDDDDAMAVLRQHLSGTVKLGRSKGAEFARCDIQVAEEAPPAWPRGKSAGGERHVTLWLLEDACLLTPQGQPTLQPDALTIGLAGATFEPAFSHVRHRSFSTWNAHRGCHGLDRQCLAAGSVLCFSAGASAFSDDDLEALSGGIGTFREAGMGRVWLNPPLLENDEPVFAPYPPSNPDSAAAQTPGAAVRQPPAPETDLIRYVQARLQRPLANPDTWARARLDEWAALLSKARKFGSTPDQLPLGPLRSQWGRVAQECRDAADAADLSNRLFGPSGVMKPDANPEWAVKLPEPPGSLLASARHVVDSLLGAGGPAASWARKKRTLALWARYSGDAGLDDLVVLEQHLAQARANRPGASA